MHHPPAILVRRLEWLHALASRDRWWEEHILLFTELRRVGKTFRYEQREWLKLTTWAGYPGIPARHVFVTGVRANAWRKVVMYEGLAAEAELRFATVQKAMPPFRVDPLSLKVKAI